MNLPKASQFESFATSHYRCSFVPGDARRLIISISSIGFCHRETRFEQFYRGILSTGASAIFLADWEQDWFNNHETNTVFNLIGEVSLLYEHVSIIGHSMGGSGALLMSNYVQNASRVLASAPQFSMAPPFICFDTRYNNTALSLETHYFDNFGTSPLRDNGCYLLYGNLDWRDHVHRTMFETAGFKTVTVDNASHEVAIYLHRKPENALQPLIDLLADFEQPFTLDSVQARIANYHTSKSLRLPIRIRNNENYLGAPAMLQTPAWPNIALNQPAMQSSASGWSVSNNPGEDAARAVSGTLGAPFAFHTEFEERPWWSVAFARQSAIHEVRIHNRIDTGESRARASQFAIDIADDAGEWKRVFSKLTSDPFGGADGYPFCWRPEIPVTGKRLRIQLFGHQILHLAQVEVFGHPINAEA